MQNVVRSLQVFEAVANHQPVRVGHLATILDLPKSTVQRSLATLAEAGWIQASNAAGDVTHWSITARAINIARRGSGEIDLRDAAIQPMHKLRDATGETTYLSIPDGPRGHILIERVDSTQELRTFSHLGPSDHYHSTSLGLAILAHLPLPVVDEVLNGQLRRKTERTIVDPDKLRAELKLIHERGYALNLGESRAGVCGVGAPILDSVGAPVAGISISMPESRFSTDRIPELAGHVCTAAAEVAANLAR